MAAESVSPAQQISELPEEDSLSSLEERIHRAVELVSTLRAERDAAIAERDSARAAAGGALAEAQKLRGELENLRAERKQARTRIEKLIRQMESL